VFQNKWVPRRAETGPKTIKEVHSEAKLEQMNNKMKLDLNSMRKQSQQLKYVGARSGTYYGGNQQRQKGDGPRMSQRSSHSSSE